jgi:hypothetical protein
MSLITRNAIGLAGFVTLNLIADYSIRRLLYGQITETFRSVALAIFWLVALLTAWLVNRHAFASVQRRVLRLLFRGLLVGCATAVFAFFGFLVTMRF